MQKLIKSGRLAIEYRMLGVIIRPRVLNDADNTEMDELTALLRKYNELMAAYEAPINASKPANDENGGKE
ncbi:MAG: hypothetical protein WBM09_07515 [Gallionella sp.]